MRIEFCPHSLGPTIFIFYYPPLVGRVLFTPVLLHVIPQRGCTNYLRVPCHMASLFISIHQSFLYIPVLLLFRLLSHIGSSKLSQGIGDPDCATSNSIHSRNLDGQGLKVDFLEVGAGLGTGLGLGFSAASAGVHLSITVGSDSIRAFKIFLATVTLAIAAAFLLARSLT
jgi:hypothetical protein